MLEMRPAHLFLLCCAIVTVAPAAVASPETVTHVKVYGDGRGTITVKAVGLSAPVDEALCRRLAPAFGPQVRFAELRNMPDVPESGDFVAHFTFPDISLVTVSPESGRMIASRPAAPVDRLVGYSFRFTAGPTNCLSILQPPPVPPGGAGSSGNLPETLRNRKDSVVLSVSGDILETNSSFRSRKHPNMLVLFYMDCARIATNPAGLRLLSGNPEEPIPANGVAGLLAEPAGKEVVVLFREQP